MAEPESAEGRCKIEPGGISLSGFVLCAPLNTSLRTKADSRAGSKHSGEHCSSSTAMGLSQNLTCQKYISKLTVGYHWGRGGRSNFANISEKKFFNCGKIYIT